MIPTPTLRDFFGDTLASGWPRQWFAIVFEILQQFVDDLAQLGVHLGFIIAVAALTDDSRALADEALILIGPFHDLDVSRAVVHDRDS